MTSTVLNLLAIAFFVASLSSMIRSSGFSLACLAPLGLAVYLPIRALLINSGLASYESGTNPRALMVSAANRDIGASVNLLVAVAFFAGLNLGLLKLAQRSSARTATTVTSSTWRRLVTILFFAGAPGLAQQLLSSLSIFASTEFETSGGVVGQLAFLSYFAMCASVFLNALTIDHGSTGRMIMLLIPLCTALAGGSKDTLITVGLAASAGFIARWTTTGRPLPRQLVTRLGLGGALTILVLFPAIQTYRIGVETRELGLFESIREMPSTYSTYDVATGRELPSDASNTWVGSLIYLSNRFHGYDSLVLTLETERDASYLPLLSVAAIPSTLVLPVGTIGESLEPRQFATEIWGSAIDGSVHVAMGATTQAYKAYGHLGSAIIGGLLGLIVAASHRSLRSQNVAVVMVGLVFLLTALAFEREILVTAATSIRRLAVVALIAWLAQILQSRVRQRETRGLLGSNKQAMSKAHPRRHPGPD